MDGNKPHRVESQVKEIRGRAISISRSAPISNNMMEYLPPIPFFLCVIFHTYLLLEQIEITHTQTVRPEIRYPIIAMAIGGITDNIRLALGNVLGDNPISKWLAYMAYFLKVVGQPSLFLTMSSVLESLYFYDEKVLKVIVPCGLVLATMFTLDGIHSFLYKVAGNLVPDSESGIIYYTLDPSKKSFLLILPKVVVSSCSIFLGAAILLKTQESWFLIVQVMLFLSHTVIVISKRKGLYMDNLLDVLFLGALIRAQKYI